MKSCGTVLPGGCEPLIMRIILDTNLWSSIGDERVTPAFDALMNRTPVTTCTTSSTWGKAF